ncbi:MAG: RNA methyltransferase [Bacteroidetes bacterium]|nr:RNA methyltransferase [Bacteroidota bacterium]MBI3482354.1 RNA methyltransferase [Bacteroidota bacterium]
MLSKEQLLINHFSQYVTEHKKDFIEKVLKERTRHITLVLEDIYQSQNASAVLRTCECLGLQDVHIIEDDTKYSVNKRVLKGANKWIDLHRYKMKGFNNSEICFRKLRESGYRILVTDPSPDGVSINEIVLDQKIAVVMGNELHGTSEFAINSADQKIFIPMHGFTESFNISVSAAIILNTLLTKMRGSNAEWHLTDTEKESIRLQWLRKIVRRSDLIEQEFLKTIK